MDFFSLLFLFFVYSCGGKKEAKLLMATGVHDMRTRDSNDDGVKTAETPLKE